MPSGAAAVEPGPQLSRASAWRCSWNPNTLSQFGVRNQNTRSLREHTRNIEFMSTKLNNPPVDTQPTRTRIQFQISNAQVSAGDVSCGIAAQHGSNSCSKLARL